MVLRNKVYEKTTSCVRYLCKKLTVIISSIRWPLCHITIARLRIPPDSVVFTTGNDISDGMVVCGPSTRIQCIVSFATRVGEDGEEVHYAPVHAGRGIIVRSAEVIICSACLLL